jgi:hypothetical protein
MDNDLLIKILCAVVCIVIPTITGIVCMVFRKRLNRAHYPADNELLAAIH